MPTTTCRRQPAGTDAAMTATAATAAPAATTATGFISKVARLSHLSTGRGVDAYADIAWDDPATVVELTDLRLALPSFDPAGLWGDDDPPTEVPRTITSGAVDDRGR